MFVLKGEGCKWTEVRAEFSVLGGILGENTSCRRFCSVYHQRINGRFFFAWMVGTHFIKDVTK